MHKLLFLLAVLGIATLINAQTGTITGQVTTSDGKPAELVNIMLAKTNRGATVNAEGRYMINKVPAGRYTIIASFTGLITQQTEITVTAGQTTAADFRLTESNQELQEVVVRSSSHSVTNKASDMIARMPIRNLENPQVYNIVGKELIKQQNIIALTDAFGNAPGVTPILYPSGGIGALSRGFSTDVNARNGLQSTAGRSSADIANVERIEFIKGPSGTLFGGGISSFGGVVNLVTKKPFETFKGQVDLSLGSFNLGRISTDINAPLNSDKTLLFRANGAIQKQDSYNERGFYNSAIFAPSLLYKATDRLNILIDAEIYSVNSVRPSYTRINESAGIRSYADLPLDYKRSLLSNDLDAKSTGSKFFAEAKYQINDNWTSTTALAFTNEYVERSYQDYPVWYSRDSVAIDVSKYGPVSNTYTNFQQNFNGSFKTGSLKHTFLAGLNFTQAAGYGQSGGTGVIRRLSVNSPGKVDRALVDSALIPGAMMDWGTLKNITYAAYVSNVINFSDRLYAMLSLRYDYMDARSKGPWASPYTQGSLSPKLGLVYQVIKDKVSVFGSYMNGFQNYPPITQPDGSSFTVKPIYAVQYEAGVKAELLDKKINTTLSYYYIDINNAIRYTADFYAFQDGQQVSKGIEWDFTANPTAGLTLVLGYGYNDNCIINTEGLEGNKVSNAPAHIGNYWVNYQFQSGGLKNFGIGAGGNYVSDAYFDDANLFLLPAYHIIGATAFYENDKWRVGAKLNNIGNQKSWGFWGAPNPTRNFVANFTFKF